VVQKKCRFVKANKKRGSERSKDKFPTVRNQNISPKGQMIRETWVKKIPYRVWEAKTKGCSKKKGKLPNVPRQTGSWA